MATKPDITKTPLYKKMVDEIGHQLWSSFSTKAPDGYLQDPDKDLVNDYGFDDLDGVEAIMVIEDNFDIHINDEIAAKIKTMRDFYETVLSFGIDENGEKKKKE